nr:RNA-directed DNA polymerase, eukaryota, reverse transcriptase zinc-binding domain protein [Tanacetum cinerariifolium]
QTDSLWVRVIHAIHGVDGRIGIAGNVGYTSIWCDIIKEMDMLASHGIDLISMMHKKIGNGLNTSFWKDRMSRSGIESEQWGHLLDSLEGVMLNPSEDRWSWDLNGSEEFSVASARRSRTNTPNAVVRLLDLKLKNKSELPQVVPKEVTEEDAQQPEHQHSYCFNVEDAPKIFNEAMKSQDVAFWKEAINDEMDSIMGNNT